MSVAGSAPAAEAAATTTRSLADRARLFGAALDVGVRGRLGLTAALMLGCTPASSASTQSGGATLRPVCGPADGPAVMLQVPERANAQYPYFRLRIDRPIGQVAGQRVEVRDPDTAGPSAEWCDADACRVIRSTAPTTAVFGQMRSDSSVSVELRTTAPDGKPFSWAGVAPWHGETLVCG